MEETPVEIDDILIKKPFDEAERFNGFVAALLNIDFERLVLGRERAALGATEIKPAAAQYIERCDIFRDKQRIAERQKRWG